MEPWRVLGRGKGRFSLWPRRGRHEGRHCLQRRGGARPSRRPWRQAARGRQRLDLVPDHRRRGRHFRQRHHQAIAMGSGARRVWERSKSDVFVTKPGAFTDLAVAAIEEVTGRRPELSTSGGTSDARFISSYCPVIEFGLVGQTMHQIDERTPVSDLEKLTRIYRGVLDRYFG